MSCVWGLFWTFLRVDVNKHESSHIMFLGINECGKIPPVQQFAHLGWRTVLSTATLVYSFQGYKVLSCYLIGSKKYWNMSSYMEIVLLLCWNDSIAFISKVETVASIGIMHLRVFSCTAFQCNTKDMKSLSPIKFP